MPRPLFIAATRQHVGKTTVSLALLSGLQKRFGRVGFIKPVGQQHVTIDEGADTAVRVDKDVQLMKEYFSLDHLDYQDMSPVIVPRAYTKAFIDGEVSTVAQEATITQSMERIRSSSGITLCEGTGHVGVGSIIGLSNAEVAKLVGADVVLVANGGIGSAFDELEMNRVMLKECGVRLRGVVLNKVMPDKVDMVRDYVGRVVRERWGVPLLGVVPDLPFLGKATLGDLEKLLEGELIAGQQHRGLHYGTQDLQCVTTAVRRFLRKTDHGQQSKGERRPLFVTHLTRDDVLLGYLAHYKRVRYQTDASGEWDSVKGVSQGEWLGALVLCGGDGEGLQQDNSPMPFLKEIASAYDAPIMLTGIPTIEATNKISKFTAKMHIGDRGRVAAAIAHYERHLDFDMLLNGL